MPEPYAIHLSTLFGAGVEHLQFINDICGSPIELEYFDMRLFFNGIVFQEIYKSMFNGSDIFDICNRSVFDGFFGFFFIISMFFFKFQYEKTSLFEQLYDIVIEDIEDRIVKPKLSIVPLREQKNLNTEVKFPSLGRGRLCKN